MNSLCVFQKKICLIVAMLVVSPLCMSTETMPGVDSHYSLIEVSDGSRLQTIVTLPEGDPSPRHPLLFTQWVSCGSVEFLEGRNSHELLATLAADSGLALVRLERSAISNGPECEALDFDTEYLHYLEAFRQLLDSDFINPEKIYIHGSSLGSVTAPLIAQKLQDEGFDIAGVMVQGGGAVTYYERMLAFDRYYLERRPDAVSPGDIHDEFLLRAKFHYEYLVNGRHPDDVAADNAEMRAVRNDILGLGDNEHYGRPFAWHQQIARKNILAAWAGLDAPVLVIFNNFDQFESRHGHRLIVDTINRLRPGTAHFVERNNIGHSDNRYETIEDAYAFKNGTAAWTDAAQIMLAWLAGIQSSATSTDK